MGSPLNVGISPEFLNICICVYVFLIQLLVVMLFVSPTRRLAYFTNCLLEEIRKTSISTKGKNKVLEVFNSAYTIVEVCFSTLKN